MTQLNLFADFPGFADASAPHDCPVTADPIDAVAETAGQSDLMRLAGLIRQSRLRMEAETRRRSRPIQSIGDLARSVILRHDLVARRRSEAAAALTDTRDAVNVAS